ncbi:MAG: hypothetical protein P4L56_29175 [Candidatus Sulfopaludibacter sp.]|nr:hypothetical protein [Candidatus Sulfopaludibacter sp.]
MESLRRRPQPPKPNEEQLPHRRTAALPSADPSSGAAHGSVQVIWGASVQTLELGGMQVQHARELLRTLMHIDPAAPALIDGVPARANQRINQGQTLEFVIHAGEKGNGY